jgi:hypothetical protein
MSKSNLLIVSEAAPVRRGFLADNRHSEPLARPINNTIRNGIADLNIISRTFVRMELA